MPDEKSNPVLPYIPLVGTVVDAISRGGPKRQFKYNKKIAQYQNDLNRKNAAWTMEQNKKLLQYQLDWDSPASQMARYEAAGLNKNLVYGQGTPGNMGSPQQMAPLPGVNAGSVDAGSLGSLGTDFLRASQMQAQIGLTEQKTSESQVRTEVLGVQKAIAQSNPMLNPAVAQSVSNSMIAIADAKAAEGKWKTELTWTQKESGEIERSSNVAKQLDAELGAMIQKLGLNTQDKKIKNEILESKQFENALKEIQLRWMKDGNVTPQHIYQGLMLILSKMM